MATGYAAARSATAAGSVMAADYTATGCVAAGYTATSAAADGSSTATGYTASGSAAAAGYRPTVTDYVATSYGIYGCPLAGYEDEAYLDYKSNFMHLLFCCIVDRLILLATIRA